MTKKGSTNPSCHVKIMSTSNFKLSALMEVMCHGCFGTEEFAVGVHFPLQGKKNPNKSNI